MTRVAAPAADVQHELLVKRRVPCICPRQFEDCPPIGVPLRASISREMVVERIECSSCDRTWTRINTR